MRKHKIIYKFFPFSGGIRWELNYFKYINPKIDLDTWKQAVDGKDIVVTVFGGILESLTSLMVMEALNYLCPSQNIYWLGNNTYSNLHYINGIGKNCNINLTPKIIKKYPAPLFFDKDNRIYFNLLFNFLIKKSHWGRYPQERDEPVFEQIFSNSSIPFNISYLPKFRKLGTDFIDGLFKLNKLTLKTKIITIVLEKTNNDILNWSVQQIKEFVQIVSAKGFKVVVFSHDISRFYGSKILAFQYDIRNIFQIIQKTKLLLSNDIQWLLAGLLISNTGVVCKNENGPYDIFKNAEYIGVENDIFSYRDRISTLDVVAIAEGL